LQDKGGYIKVIEIKNTQNVEILLSVARSYLENADDLEIIKKQLQQELSQAGHNRLIFVGSIDDINVAFVQLVLNDVEDGPEFANGKDIAHIHNLQVKKELQGQGLGKRMMAFVEEKARKMGVKTLTLGVDDSNHRAIEFYKKLGYGVFRDLPGRLSGEIVYGMRKILRRSENLD
jgi:ribosomal protein S18 acetylase RimI-like enzyme